MDYSYPNYTLLVNNSVTAEKPETKSDRHHFDPFLKIQRTHPQDLIFAFALPILEAYNNQDFFYEANPLLFEALSISPTLFYDIKSTSAVHLLVRSGLFIKVQLKLFCDLDLGWAAATVKVKDGDRWLRLGDFLRTLPEVKGQNWAQAALDEQWKSWRAVAESNAATKTSLSTTVTHKQTSFMSLAAETRKRIFLYAVAESIELRFTTPRQLEDGSYDSGDLVVEPLQYGTSANGLSILQGSQFQRKDDWTQIAALKPVQTNVLGFNKALRAEALEALWLDTTKVFRQLPGLEGRLYCNCAGIGCSGHRPKPDEWKEGYKQCVFDFDDDGVGKGMEECKKIVYG
ncbi:hypothetical protein LTR78_000289 [Recurvomyces mirabilis]|uniref:Uncharacterized protein n=1 Tax=Recurvomyces mirabilis TaxID=574656 RepID=A0AAE0WXG0_9PEZI|nr:hypothetical protein LTR78_000289 [Recurvomyces mirabilis]KAK5161944.1 hypothetical protein LTS14_000290 [Recurvomyces mirabilis]